MYHPMSVGSQHNFVDTVNIPHPTPTKYIMQSELIEPYSSIITKEYLLIRTPEYSAADREPDHVPDMG